ncbi:transcription initiation factor TFIID subunit 4-like isoform X4 [Narcine bancroftii]|uniref:transcription initiation factor TFIID subunit 4-like isoform X4 n=1 Tax=Narcine bancroftii TaxID=1343680 RepID=UPI003831E0F2
MTWVAGRRPEVTDEAGARRAGAMPAPDSPNPALAPSGPPAPLGGSGPVKASGGPRAGPQQPPPQPPPAAAPPAALPKVNAASPQLRAPRAAQTTVPVLHNVQVPAGMVLVRSDSGQLVLVPQKAFAQAQAKVRAQTQGSGGTSTATPTSTTTVRIPNVQTTRPQVVADQVKTPGVQQMNRLQAPIRTNALPQRITLVQSQPLSGVVAAKSLSAVTLNQSTPGSSDPAQVLQTSVSPETLENVKKCKNFLATLIKLASGGSQSGQMSNNVKTLVQKLLDGKLEVEEFTSQLYQELKSSPQPYLVPFLKVVQQSGAISKPQESLLPRFQTVTLQRPLNHITVPASQIQVKAVIGGPATSVVKAPTVEGKGNSSILMPVSTGEKLKREVGSTFREEDDINDVASMAGVNINEENARILATNSELVGAVIRSYKEETFLFSVPLQKKILEIGMKHCVTQVNSDTLNIISQATQEHLRELVERLTLIAQHRMKVYKDNDQYNLSGDTRSQLKFFEQLDQLEKQRRDEDEREIMLRLAKSRAKHEDPEQLRLKQRAKEMQQLELAQLAQREANLAALAAIGPRKRKTPDSPSLGAGSEGLCSSGSAQPRPLLRPRVTRVNLRDLVLCLEQDQAASHSLLLYRAYLK